MDHWRQHPPGTLFDSDLPLFSDVVSHRLYTVYPLCSCVTSVVVTRVGGDPGLALIFIMITGSEIC